MDIANSICENQLPDNLPLQCVSADASQLHVLEADEQLEAAEKLEHSVSHAEEQLLPAVELEHSVFHAEEQLAFPESSPSPSPLSSPIEEKPVAHNLEKISVSMEEAGDKDEIVKQHMRIAEEAIAGWEKAEAVAAELKEKLGIVEEQKLAAEDRVSHLDGALKECMKQLRHVREEQEQKIHDALVKKTSDWEKIRVDMESKLHNVTKELCDALAEKQTMSKSLNELKGTKSRLQADNVKCQTSLASVEKENATLKYEIQAMRKELELRNQEREDAKRFGELANKQNLDNKKKLGKLEEECQRLKFLLRKRSPNTNSVKIPSEMPTTDKGRRPSPCRRSWTTALPLNFTDVDSAEDYLEDGIREENNILNDRILSMQEETVSLKKLLGQKDEELQSARRMYAEAVSKLSLMEKKFETHQSLSFSASQSANVHIQPRRGSVSSSEESKEGNVSAESWASALISELAQFRKNSISDGSQTCSLSLDMMDDFAEMEKLASLSSPHANEDDRRSSNSLLDCEEKQVEGQTGCAQTFDFNKICKQLTEKLKEAEIQRLDIIDKQTARDTRIDQLEELHVIMCGIEENNMIEAIEGTIEHENDEKKKLDSEVSGNNVYESFTGNMKANVWSCKSISQAKELPITADLDFHNAGAELVAAVRKVVQIVESIGQTDCSFLYSERIFGSDLETNEENPSDCPERDWRRSGINACAESLINLCKSLVHDKVDIMDFIAEVVSALDWLVGLIFAVAEQSPSRDCNHVQSDKGKILTESCDSELTSAGSSPLNAIAGKNVKKMEAQDITIDQSSVSDMSFQFSDSSVQESDISKFSSEHAALMLNLEAEMKRANKYESEILRLKLVNEKLGHTHEATMEKLTELDSELHEAKRRMQELSNELMESKSYSAKLQFELQDVLDQKHFIENIVKELEYAKSALESEICDANKNMEILLRKLAILDKELNEEIKRREEAERQYMELKKTQDFHESESISSTDDEEVKLKKEKELGEAAQKLAECQQTILNLSDQLKALGVSKNILFLPLYNPFPSPLLSSKSTFENNPQDTIGDQGREGSIWTNVKIQEEHTASWPSKSGHHGSSYAIKKERNSHEMYNKEMQPLEYYKNTASSKFSSSWNGEVPDVCSNSETVINSPSRSPVRFLSLRTKNTSLQEQPKHTDSDNGEINAFSRFFGRTRSSH